MNRRNLIAGVATLATANVLASTIGPLPSATATLATNAAPSARQAPANPLTLADNDLEVVFDPEHGLPYSYSYKGQQLWGEDKGEPISAILCTLNPRDYKAVSLQAPTSKRSSRDVMFIFRAELAGALAATFQLHYVIQDASLRVTLQSVEEHAGFELIELALPNLISVREEDGPAWMAEGRHGGSFVKLSDAKSYRIPDDEYFGRLSTELPIGIVGQNGIGCVMEVTAYMDGAETEISGSTGHRHATLGTIQTHRVHGGRCYNMNDGGPPICGNANTPNLIVGQTPSTRLDFFSPADQEQPWLTGAKIIRARTPAIPTNFFSDRFLYIVAGKMKIESAPRTTFAQSRTLVHDVALLTDYAPQTVFLSGWVYDGQDTGYPSEDKVNSSLGTYDQLRSLIEDSKQWNANVTINVNYDDAYKSSPIFDEAFIARRPDGEIWKSRDWDGDVSYVVGMAKFMEGGWGARRIAYTMDHYKISDSMLIDAMSWFAIRNDWDPKHPASGYKNLVDGKYKILDQFRERGVAVTSEQMRYPFIGKLSVSMDGPGVSHCPFGGEPVPLIAIIYRGAAIWGTTGGKLNEPQQQLFWNTRSALWFQADSERSKLTDFYYLVALPFSKLHQLQVENYKSQGSVRTLLLEQHAQISMDISNESYSAKLNGIEIAATNATFCPIDEHRIAFYSRTARQLRYPLPAGWIASAITARLLTLKGRAPHIVQCNNGMMVVNVSANQPVIVYANATVIPVHTD